MSETTVYLVRHAEAEVNQNPGKVGGLSPESKLTDEGERQAAKLGHHLGRIGLKPEIMYSSLTKRSAETARIAAETIGCFALLCKDGRLNEMSQGGWEGKDRRGEYEDRMRRGVNADGIDFKMTHPDGDGESRREVGERMWEWLEVARLSSAQTILAVSHRIAIVSLLSHIEGWPEATRGYDEFARVTAPFDNTTVTVLTTHGDTWNIAFRARKPENLMKLES